MQGVDFLDKTDPDGNHRHEFSWAQMKHLLPSLVLALCCCASYAGQTAPPVRAEIDALMSRLQSSGCQFKRNGTWFSGAEAKDHLLRKLEYLEGRRTVQSAEQFIELAASKSSSSGQPYQVKCGKEPPLDSRQWLGSQLAALRSSQAKAPP